MTGNGKQFGVESTLQKLIDMGITEGGTIKEILDGINLNDLDELKTVSSSDQTDVVVREILSLFQNGHVIPENGILPLTIIRNLKK